MCEGQAQHWMKIINWENPERSLELQLGDQSTDLLYDQAWAITSQLYGLVNLGLFQSLLFGTKCKLANKNLMNFFMIITIHFGMLLKGILVFLQILIPLR